MERDVTWGARDLMQNKGRAPDSYVRGTIAAWDGKVYRGEFRRTRINLGESRLKAQVGRIIAPQSERISLG